MTVDCRHWSPGYANDVGKCSIERYGPNPHRLVCARCLAKGSPEVQASAIRKTSSWISAEVSLLINGKLPEADRDARWLACSGRTWEGEQVRPPCPSFMPEPGRDDGWCRSCGCGERRSARLRRKAAMPKATCPIGVWAAD